MTTSDPITVLVVDDEADTVQMLTTALALFNIQIVPAYTGLEAVEQFERHHPQAVILDLMLPDIDGYEVARRLRATPDRAGVPILVLSATADSTAQERSLAAGATHFFRKPVPIRDLGEAIRSAVETGPAT
jgi:CheY-like chemotaxis protein